MAGVQRAWRPGSPKAGRVGAGPAQLARGKGRHVRAQAGPLRAIGIRTPVTYLAVLVQVLTPSGRGTRAD